MTLVHSLLAWLAGTIVAIIAWGGYAGVALLMAIESACVPLPSELIMPFAGYLVSTGRLNLWAVATAGAIGCNLGSVVAYEVGRRGGRPFVARFGRYVLVSMDDLDRAEGFFRRWGGIAVLVCRLLPVVRTFIAVPAGLARMNRWRFHIYTFSGSWPFCFVLAYVGARLGAAWDRDPRVKALFHKADVFIVMLLALAAAGFLWQKLRAARR